MRWEQLFADLEGEFDAGKRAEQEAEIAEQTRAELSQVTFTSRLRAQVGALVVLQVAGLGAVDGRLSRMGADFVLLDRGSTSWDDRSSEDADTVIPVDAITAATALPPQAVADAAVGLVASRLPLRSVLRRLAADRAYVMVRRRSGESDGGTLARVGADFVDLAVHDASAAPRADAVRRSVTIRTAAIGLVSRQSPPW